MELNILNPAAYITGWASKLRDSQKWNLCAASRAENAADYILGISFGFAQMEETDSAVKTETPILEHAL